MVEQKGLEYWSKYHSEGYIAIPDFDLARFFENNLFNPSSPLFRPLDMLDVGCGCGTNVQYMRSRFSCLPININGIDFCPSAIDICKHRGITGCNLGDFMSIEPNSYDVLIDIECLTNLGIDGLKHAYKVLKPGGVLFSKMFTTIPCGVRYVPGDSFLFNRPGKNKISKIFDCIELVYNLHRINNNRKIFVKEAVWLGQKE